MALDGTYAGLKAAVGDFLNRSDLTAAIGDFIVLAEAQMARRFVTRARDGLAIPRWLVTCADAELAPEQEYLAAPSDMLGPLSLSLAADPVRMLDYLDPANLAREKARDRWSGAPKFYSLLGESLQLYPVADTAYGAEITYLARPPALSEAAPANWILTNHPDAYLYGALTAAAPYLKDDARTQVWGALFTAAMDDICNADPMPPDMTLLRTEVHHRRCAGDFETV